MKHLSLALIFFFSARLLAGQQVLHFDGQNDIYIIPELQNFRGNDFTVNVEFKVNAFESKKNGVNYIRQFIIFKENTNKKYFNEAFTLYVDEYRKGIWLTVTSKEKKQVHLFSGKNSIETGKWYNAQFSINPEKASLSLNGELKSTNTTGFSVDFSGKPFFLGGRLAGHDDKTEYGGRFNGQIRNLEISENHEKSGPGKYRYSVYSLNGSEEAVPQAGGDLKEANNLKLFPNPASDKLTAQITLPRPGEYSIEIHTSSGKAVKEVKNRTFENLDLEFDIDIAGLPNGLYFLVVRGNTGIITAEFLINK